MTVEAAAEAGFGRHLYRVSATDDPDAKAEEGASDSGDEDEFVLFNTEWFVEVGWVRRPDGVCAGSESRLL